MVNYFGKGLAEKMSKPKCKNCYGKGFSTLLIRNGALVKKYCECKVGKELAGLGKIHHAS